MKLSVIIPVYNQEELIVRAINSIPERDDIEIIVIDDCSIDDTLNTVRRIQQNTGKNLCVLYNRENKGVGYTVNRGLDVATGEYIVLLGSDDYFVDLDRAMEELDGTDLIYFDLETNDGTRFILNERTKVGYCGSTKFMRREFVGETREPELRAGEDWYFYKELLKKKPTEKFTHQIYKHYNFPRENSLSDLKRKGKL